MLKVELKSAGDTSKNQDPARPLPGVKDKIVRVADIAEASTICGQFIAENDLGERNWTGGRVIDEVGKLVGQVSYDGRVRDPNGNPIHGFVVTTVPSWIP